MPRDRSSHSNTDQIVTNHIHASLHVDFSRSVLTGYVDLSLRAIQADVEKVILDTRELAIHRVSNQTSNTELSFVVGDSSALGSALTITLGKKLQAGDELRLRVEYETTPSSSGLLWLPAEQTDGKVHPYLFSQFQAIHCRSSFPVQDSPSVKSTYTARLFVQEPLIGLMSAIPIPNEELAEYSSELPPKSGYKAFSFRQDVPIPSYLIAIVVGALESRDIGPRTRIWSEVSRLEEAAKEFSDTDGYLKAAEEILTPYEFGRYDLLMLPGSFPYGGMENPCLTFITPTLLAGDQSLTSVVAHEIAHSWTGNLVTNSTWDHFWLNEGFTVFVERKIIGKLFSEAHRHLECLLGWKHIKTTVDNFGANGHHPYTRMVPELDGVDPDDAFSLIPYEKGSAFLFWLENLVGQDSFALFLKKWILRYRRTTATTADFRDFFAAEFPQHVNSVEWDKWLFTTGLPPIDVSTLFDKSLATASFELAQTWLNSSDENPPSATDPKSQLEGWSTNQKLTFLEGIKDGGDRITRKLAENLESRYHFSKGNSEIRFLFFLVAIKAGYHEVYPQIVEFLRVQGRMKFVRPLYRALGNRADSRDLALQTFNLFQSRYHNIAKKMIAQDLSVSPFL